ncbi:MAG TPA: NAD-dependent epimerase/dehydratase family protein [Acidimicrobiales bacterium]|jgi:nucleoside-diphosphate-sugar epimerase
MRVFVAGATGVIGRRAVDELVRGGHEVTGVARTDAKASWLTERGATPVAVDLLDRGAVTTAVADHDAVVNLATHIPTGPEMMFRRAWRQNDRLRKTASQLLAEAAAQAGAEVFVQESITLLYDDGGDAWLDENAPIKPTVFTRTAIDAEDQARWFAAQSGRGVVLRFASFMAPESAHTAKMVAMVRKGTLPLLGRPEGFEPLVDADDAARAVVAALHCPSGTYNIVEDAPATRAEHAEALSAALGRPVHLPPAWVGRLPRLAGLGRSRRPSHGAFSEATGWGPKNGDVRSMWPELLGERQPADRV